MRRGCSTAAKPTSAVAPAAVDAGPTLGASASHAAAGARATARSTMIVVWARCSSARRDGPLSWCAPEPAARLLADCTRHQLVLHCFIPSRNGGRMQLPRGMRAASAARATVLVACSPSSSRVPPPYPSVPSGAHGPARRQYPTPAVVGAPRAHCSGMRCRMRWLAQVGAPEADEASEFSTQVRSAPPPAVVARFPRPCLLYRPCTAVRAPPAQVTHARAHMAALWNAPRGVRVGGIQRCNPPELGRCVRLRCHRIHRMPLCALAHHLAVHSARIMHGRGTCTVRVVRYAHAQ
jgi:hypothetical protein